MVMLLHPMLFLSSPTALRLVANPRTLSGPYLARHASATARMVVVFPVPAGPMTAPTILGLDNA